MVTKRKTSPQKKRNKVPKRNTSPRRRKIKKKINF